MTCFVCKGTLENKYTNFIADLGNCIIIVKDVPSQVCTQCGEVSYSDAVARELERIVEEMRRQPMEIVVTHFADMKAA